jgi:hypothetical protein
MTDKAKDGGKISLAPAGKIMFFFPVSYFLLYQTEKCFG